MSKNPRLIRVIKLPEGAEPGDKHWGDAFGSMMRFVNSHHMIQMELVGETHGRPAIAERLVVQVPQSEPITIKGIKAVRVLDRRRGGRRS